MAPRVVAVVTGAYLLNPALIFESAYWGQTAAVHTVFMLLALIAADQRFYAVCGAAFGAAILTKPQALAIAPLLFVLTWRDKALVKFCAAAFIAAVFITLPFLVTGNIDGVVTQYLNTTEYHPVLSANAHNLWWLVSGGHSWKPDTFSSGGVSFRTIGLSLFLASSILSGALVWRNRNALFFAAAYQSLAFFMLNTQIHENHALPMFVFLVVAAATFEPIGWYFYGGFAITTLANMALHDPNLIRSFGHPRPLRFVNATAQLLLFGLYTYCLIDPRTRRWMGKLFNKSDSSCSSASSCNNS